MFGRASRDRHALKYLDQRLFRSISKRATTKKKYSELPALNAPSEHAPDVVPSSEIASNAHHAFRSHTPECARFHHHWKFTAAC
jgi:hypothetical protein